MAVPGRDEKWRRAGRSETIEDDCVVAPSGSGLTLWCEFLDVAGLFPIRIVSFGRAAELPVRANFDHRLDHELRHGRAIRERISVDLDLQFYFIVAHDFPGGNLHPFKERRLLLPTALECVAVLKIIKGFCSEFRAERLR